MDTMQNGSDQRLADHNRSPEDREAPGEIPATLATDATPSESKGDGAGQPAASAPPATPTQAPADDGPPKKLKPRLSTVLAMTLVAIVGVGLIFYAWRLGPFASPVVTTENSYVRGQITVLAPQVNGYVAEVLVRDFQHVKAGDALIRIDERIYRQELEQAEATREQARANLANADQTVAQNEAEIGAREADLFQAEAELARAKANAARADTLTNQGLKPQAETDQVVANLRSAEAGVLRAKAAIEIARQTLRSTQVNKRSLEASVRVADARIGLARINLSNTVIRAPRDGQVSEASVRPGQYVSAGSQLMFLVPEALWVVANYKETQTHYVRIGQPASFAVDALGGQRFTGTVVELSPATGSEFSVLRPDNASGNFTKVVQRLPVRIAPDPDQPDIEQLRPGMSVVTQVDTASAAPAEQGALHRLLPDFLQR
ncbi:HlyD family secretion protein [Aureimonas sp. AU20]|uniref:HlyD family secretion protein n=1 Tax=Aureimonas sp. AU20 TaxID=1349819 RepID=UPI000720E4C8|nr:HlyD family secretion protein [Aureimonas sp. AU20]ALN75043.1 hypothetical protein M673_20145 [Aureimonas sp. AU20]